jgi:hypothetical protein
MLPTFRSNPSTGLFQVTVCQSLFIAPCSHVYHYKCIRPLLEMHYPGFSCPLCRTFADLEADVELEAAGDTKDAPTEVDVREPAEDVEMALEDVEEGQEQADEAEAEDADRTSSSVGSTGAAPIDANLAGVAIPRRPSPDGAFPGAEATPLNSTFLATLARSGEGSGGLGAIAMSDEAEGDDEDGEAGSDDAGQDGEGNTSGVGGKRKR